MKYEIDGFTYKVGDKYLIRTVQDLNEEGFNNIYKIRCFIRCSDDPDSIYVEIQEPTRAFSLIYVRNLHWLHEQDKIRPCKQKDTKDGWWEAIEIVIISMERFMLADWTVTCLQFSIELDVSSDIYHWDYLSTIHTRRYRNRNHQKHMEYF